MNQLVRMTKDDDGEIYENPKWCLVVIYAGGPQNFCQGALFGQGESGVEFTTKVSKRGGITCPECLKKIREIKAVRL